MKKSILLIFALCLFIFACEEGDQESPGKIDDLVFFTDPSAVQFSQGRVQLAEQEFPSRTYALAWTATGDNGDEGEASLYDLRYLSETERKSNGIDFNKICDENNSLLHKVYGEPFPKPSGEPEVFNLMNLELQRGETYFFCLWAIDEIAQRSAPAFAQGKIPFLGVPLKSQEINVDMGEVVAGIGDFNQDGYSDLALSSPSQSKVAIFYGREDDELFEIIELFGSTIRQTKDIYADLVITGESGEQFGSKIIRLNDIDRDGKNDIAISAPSVGKGKIYLFNSPSLSSLSSQSAWAVIEGETTGSNLGKDMAFCNDLNSDGYSDFLIADPNLAKVYIVLGGEDGSTLGAIPQNANIAEVASVVIEGDTASEFAQAVACGSDLNGDGAPDILLSAPLAENAQAEKLGAVYLFLGGDNGVIDFSQINSRNLQIQINLKGGDSADLKILGTEPDAEFGKDIAMLGDVWSRSIEDLSRDFAVSAPGGSSGKIFLFWGGAKGNLGLAQLTSPQLADASKADMVIQAEQGKEIEGKIKGGADINEDGHNDLIYLTSSNQAVLIYLDPTKPSSSLQYEVFSAQSSITDFALGNKFSSTSPHIVLGIAGTSTGYLLK